jgi:hypothetical protein
VLLGLQELQCQPLGQLAAQTEMLQHFCRSLHQPQQLRHVKKHRSSRAYSLMLLVQVRWHC